MRSFGIAAAASIILAAMTAVSHAEPQDYCDPYARQAASHKTGLDMPQGTIGGTGDTAVPSDSAAVSPDQERWRAAYDSAFADCMKTYEPREAAVVKKPVTSATHKSVKHRRKAIAAKSAKPASKIDKSATEQKTASKSTVKRRNTETAGDKNAAPAEPNIKATADTPAEPKVAAKPAAAEQKPERCHNLVCLLRRPKPAATQ